MQGFVFDRDYSGYESITVSDTAIGFTAGTITPTTGEYANKTAEVAFCRVETANIRYRMDGTDPTAAEGILLQANETLMIIGTNNIMRFKAIRVSSDATLKVTYGWRY